MSLPPNLQALRAALDYSPDNIPLRLHFAASLLAENFYADAEREYKEVLALSPHNLQAKTGLAKACFKQQKFSVALIIMEEIVEEDNAEPEILLLYAKALYQEGNLEEAGQWYRSAVEADQFLADAELDKVFRAAAPQGSYDAEEEDEPAAAQNLAQRLKVEKPNVNFDSVGGMERVKEEIRMKIIHPLNHPDLYKAYGKKVGGGILLYGPPGCGKTHLARATAGQVNARFLNVGISEVLDMWIGSSEKKLHDIFELARNNTPCVLFFDEVDALGANRSDMKQSGGRHLINQFLSELDGIDASNEGVLILAATNAPWHLDPAFRRPGRFDRIIFVQPPDQQGKEEILKILLRDKPKEELDYAELAKKAGDFSGADLKAWVDVVIESKLEASFSSGIPQPIRQRDMINALARLNPSVREWFTVAKNYALYANDSGLYDEILSYLKIKK